MARPLREISSTGIYHVMLRGINRQVIFEHPVDYRKFIDLLCLMVSPSDELGRSLPSLCRIYAYFVTLLRYVHQNPVAGGLCRPLRNLGPVSSSCHVLQVLVKRSFAMQKGAMVPDPIAPIDYLTMNFLPSQM